MDRKELIREYKKRVPSVGIFSITNTVTGKIFLGSSMNLHGPFGRFKMELSFGGCREALLKEDCDAHGLESFEFKIEETTNPEKKDQEEELKILVEIWNEKISQAPHKFYYDSVHKY